MCSKEGSVMSHSRKRALRSPEVGAVKTPPVRASKPERSRVLEDAGVTVSTLEKINSPYFHRYLRPIRNLIHAEYESLGFSDRVGARNSPRASVKYKF
jgi:hypothetical protein